jgi:hypothetical protein
MRTASLHWLGSLSRVARAAATAALLAACYDAAPLGPDDTSAPAAAASADYAVDLGACDSLRAPAGNVVSFHAYATGVQVYRWSGTAWAFVAPSAVLYADAGAYGVVGTHYAGPTWESTSGSKVVGAVVKRCPAGPSAIPWLLLSAASAEGPGVFAGTTFVQRVNTAGGTAPADAGTAVGEVREVPYTAEYYFYRAQ